MRSWIVGLWLCATPLASAAYPPQDPSSSLDAFLRDVWAQGAGKAYGLYMGKTTVPMDPVARQSYLRDLLELAQDPNVKGIAIQNGNDSRYYPKGETPSSRSISRAGFVHFLRRRSSGQPVNERIYVNVHPRHAMEVMRFVVEELPKPEASDLPLPGADEVLPEKRGILTAKVAGPPELDKRADSIVIYASSLDDVGWALGRLSEYQASHRDHFLTDIPAATCPRLTGVGTAAEPAPHLKGGSFGMYLASIVQTAMDQVPRPSDFADFRKRVRSLLAADGVDPGHPDRLTRRP